MVPTPIPGVNVKVPFRGTKYGINLLCNDLFLNVVLKNRTKMITSCSIRRVGQHRVLGLITPRGKSALQESSRTNIFFFPISFSAPGCYPTRRRAAGGGPPSCWIAAWWRKGNVKAENGSVAAPLQAKEQILSFLLTLGIPLAPKCSNCTLSGFPLTQCSNF